MPTSTEAMTLEAVLLKCKSTGLFLSDEPLGINEPNIFGDTPLHLACGWGDLDAVRLLLSSGAAVNAIGDRGQTPLFRAATEDIAVALLQAGFDVSVTDNSGQTATKFLGNIGLSNVVKIICRKGIGATKL